MRLFLAKTDTKYVSYNLLVHCIVNKLTANSTDVASAKQNTQKNQLTITVYGITYW